MSRRESITLLRPWTVDVVTVLSGVALISGLILFSHRELWELPISLLGLVTIYSLWTGKRWAYTLSFMIASLGAALAVLGVVTEVMLLEQSVPDALWLGLLSSALWITLLIHPATKRFVGLESWSAAWEELTSGSEVQDGYWM
jgi:hypothetical protein